MRRCILILLFTLFVLLTSCGPKSAPTPGLAEPSAQPSDEITPEPTPAFVSLIFEAETTVASRFRTPAGFVRNAAEPDSFAEYLGNLPLKESGALPVTFDGLSVTDQKFEAVVQWDGIKENMRNTNTLIRLRAEYLFSQSRTSDIEYHFRSGFLFSYPKWAEGYRINVQGNRVDWVKSSASDDSAEQFQKYLSFLYAYTNTAAVEADLIPSVSPQIGDLFTENGGVMIVDMAVSESQTAVMLLKGSSPACQPYILQNTAQPELSPWFIVDGGMLYTEDGTLDLALLKRFAK